MLSTTRSSLLGTISCSALQSRTGKNISSSIGKTKVFACMRPRAASRSPRVAADVSPLPLPRHAQEVVRIHGVEVRLHKPDSEVLEGRETQRAPVLLFEELRGEAHGGPDLGVPGEPFAYLLVGVVETVLEAWVRRYRFYEGVGIQEVVGSILCGPRDESRAPDFLREPHRPFVGLLRPHRVARHELQLLDAELLPQELLLGAYVVAYPRVRESAPRERSSLIVGRGGETVADLVRDRDEVLLRI